MTTATFLHFDPGGLFVLFFVLSAVPVVVAAARYLRTVFR